MKDPRSEIINVGLLSPNAALRWGLRSYLQEDPAIEIMAEAAVIDELSRMSQHLDLLLVVLFENRSSIYQHPFFDQQPDLPVLLLSDELIPASVITRHPHRPWGFLKTDVKSAELLLAIHTLAAGFWVGESAIMNQLLSPFLSPLPTNEQSYEPLTPREITVLDYLVIGFTNKQIALRMKISEHTVKFHVSSIYSKLGATSRAEAVHLAFRLGIVSF